MDSWLLNVKRVRIPRPKFRTGNCRLPNEPPKDYSSSDSMDSKSKHDLSKATEDLRRAIEQKLWRTIHSFLWEDFRKAKAWTKCKASLPISSWYPLSSRVAYHQSKCIQKWSECIPVRLSSMEPTLNHTSNFCCINLHKNFQLPQVS